VDNDVQFDSRQYIGTYTSHRERLTLNYLELIIIIIKIRSVSALTSRTTL